MNNLPLNTGERILLEKESALMIARHSCAYKFAQNYTAGKTVLDIGCGEGYGSYYLADTAKEVLGIDYNSTVIEYAKAKYPKANLEFHRLDIENIYSLKRKFNTICCFQVIEHLENIPLFLETILSLLDSGGVFICSTPNRKDASPGRSIPFNKFHIREFLVNEFNELLAKYFKAVNLYGLKRGKQLKFYRRLKKSGLFNFLPAHLDPVKIFYHNIQCKDFVITHKDLDTALDFLAVCNP